MEYKLVYTKSAYKNIQKLDTVTKRRIKRKIEAYLRKPLFYAKKLVASTIGEYHWRIGNYRVVFDLRGKNIIVLRIEHRREIYR